MGLFSDEKLAEINRIAQKSRVPISTNVSSNVSVKKMSSTIADMSRSVEEYFSDSNAICIMDYAELEDYITKTIESGYVGLDTETTGLDRINDTIVGVSLCYLGGTECYIPIKHKTPIFDTYVPGQLTYEQVGRQLQRLVDAKTKMIFANADFDLSMTYKDLQVDLNSICYFDVLLVWRCIKEDERDNSLKGLYNKYILKGEGDPKKFSDFFTPTLFPYCKPEVAKLYAAHDAKITLDLFLYELPFVTKSSKTCKRLKMEAIADLVWNVEIPLIKVCQNMFRIGMYVDKDITPMLEARYQSQYDNQLKQLQDMVQQELNKCDYSTRVKSPFKSAQEFNPSSPIHVKYLLYTIMKVPVGKSGAGTGKDVITEMNLPITNQILKIRSTLVLMNTFVKKLPAATTEDSRIHASFRQIGAACVTGDTLIPTDTGFRRIDDICSNCKKFPGREVPLGGIAIRNKYQIREKATYGIMYENYPIITIETEFGLKLSGTYNHPVMCSDYVYSELNGIDYRAQWINGDLNVFARRSFKKLEDIVVDDIIELPVNYYTVLRAPALSSKLKVCLHSEVYTKELAAFLGMYYVRGRVHTLHLKDTDLSCRILHLNVQDNAIEYALGIISKVFPNVKVKSYSEISDIYSDACTELSLKNQRRGIFLDNLPCVIFDELLLDGENSHRRLPHITYRFPQNLMKAFLVGMSVASTINCKNNRTMQFELMTNTYEDSRFIQMYLLSIGIISSNTYNSNNNKVYYKISMNSDNYLLFMGDVGVYSPIKDIDVELVTHGIPYRARRSNNSVMVRVKQISYGTADVYDLHVPNTHSFISNGMISHNTGRLSSADPNLQNIPSHAVDIRHMFRATVAGTEEVDGTQIDDTMVSISLPGYYSMRTTSGDSVHVMDIQPGMDVWLKHNDAPKIGTVFSIEKHANDASVCDVTFAIDRR